jgi:hypothetical protein
MALLSKHTLDAAAAIDRGDARSVAIMPDRIVRFDRKRRSVPISSERHSRRQIARETTTMSTFKKER